MFDRGIVQYCANEVERQGDSAKYVVGMLDAWTYATILSSRYIEEKDIQAMSGLVRMLSITHPGWRRTPVSFMNGGSATSWMLIPRQMTLWMGGIESMTVDETVKSFLDIHPFEDGNGRVASLLYNLLKGTLHCPQPLPNYYGEQES